MNNRNTTWSTSLIIRVPEHSAPWKKNEFIGVEREKNVRKLRLAMITQHLMAMTTTRKRSRRVRRRTRKQVGRYAGTLARVFSRHANTKSFNSNRSRGAFERRRTGPWNGRSGLSARFVRLVSINSRCATNSCYRNAPFESLGGEWQNEPG